MPRTHRAKSVEREQIEFYKAYALIKDLPDKIRSFESKSDTEIQQLLHEWTYLVHDLAHSQRPGKYDKNRWDALDKMQAIKAGVIRRLRDGHSPEYDERYDWRTRYNIAVRMEAVFDKKIKLREDDLEQWAACFVDEAADNQSHLDLSPDRTAGSLSTHNSQDPPKSANVQSASAPEIQEPRNRMGATGGALGSSANSIPFSGMLAFRPTDQDEEADWEMVIPEASFLPGTSSVQADDHVDESFVLVEASSATA